jgi:preprotein translocase subunit Sec61beta
MAGQSEAAGSIGQHETQDKRPTVALTFVAFIILLIAAAHLYRGISAFFELGIFGKDLAPPFFADGGLTEAGRLLFGAGFDLAIGVACLALLTGFLRRRRWAWVTAMTWVAIALAAGVVRYFVSEAYFLNMLADVVLMLLLNLTAVHRAFGIGER